MSRKIHIHGWADCYISFEGNVAPVCYAGNMYQPRVGAAFLCSPTILSFLFVECSSEISKTLSPFSRNFISIKDHQWKVGLRSKLMQGLKFSIHKGGSRANAKNYRTLSLSISHFPSVSTSISPPLSL